MGRAVAAAAEKTTDLSIVAGVDITTAEQPFPVYPNAQAVSVNADILIDFSHPAALESILDFVTAQGIPAILASTGYSEAQIARIRQAATQIPIFFSANMSLGVSLVCALAKTAARVLGDSFDIEIIEQHHNKKVDAPSGTALLLADAISEELGRPKTYTYDRHAVRAARTKGEIAIHSVRGGTITGEHEVIFAGLDEVIKISHSAYSKALFATGALNAARFLCKQPAGLYQTSDLITQA